MTLLMSHPAACLGVFALPVVFLCVHLSLRVWQVWEEVWQGDGQSLAVLNTLSTRQLVSFFVVTEVSPTNNFRLPTFLFFGCHNIRCSVFAFLLVSALHLIDNICGSRYCIHPRRQSG